MDKRKSVIDYYQNIESKLGYGLLTWDTKHFGYYPSKKADVSEMKAQELMMDLLANRLELGESDLVLDAGCGRGTTSCYLAEKYKARVVGIDIVAFELNMAKRRAKRVGLGDIVDFYIKDYSDTKFPDNYFDKVFTLETLVHSPDIDKTLKEFYRILKPGGKLALFEYSRSHPSDFTSWENRMFDHINTGSSMTSFNTMYHDTFLEPVKKAGFEIISLEDITDNIRPSMERFYKYARSPYKLIKLFGLQRYFINTTAAVEFFHMGERGLIKYRVCVAKK